MSTISRAGTYRISERNGWYYLYQGPLFIRRFHNQTWTLDQVKAWRDGYRRGFQDGASL